MKTNKDTIYRQDAIDIVMFECGKWTGLAKEISKQLKQLHSAQPEQQHGRIFQEIVVEYPSYCAYAEYKGKPCFSIKYTENGQEFIGYGTYKPEVLSEYLKEYFMTSAQQETHEERTETHACDCISRADVEQTVEDNILCYTHSDRPIDQDPDTECHKAIRMALRMLRKDLRKLPAVQPHQIVRCKDCKYWMRENISDGYCSEMNMGDCDEDFYCGYAVRKEN